MKEDYEMKNPGNPLRIIKIHGDFSFHNLPSLVQTINDGKLFFITPPPKSIRGGELPRYKTMIWNFGIHELGEYPRGNEGLV